MMELATKLALGHGRLGEAAQKLPTHPLYRNSRGIQTDFSKLPCAQGGRVRAAQAPTQLGAPSTRSGRNGARALRQPSLISSRS